MIIDCNAIKFRFAAPKENLEVFITKLDDEIKKIERDTGIRMTYQFNKSDAKTDKDHFIQRSAMKTKKESSITKHETKSKKIDKLLNIIDKLNQNSYPKKIKKIKLIYNKKTMPDKFLAFIKKYNTDSNFRNSLSIDDPNLFNKKIEDFIKDSMSLNGYTAPFSYKIIYDNEKIKSIHVTTLPSKYVLIFKYELMINKILESSKTPPLQTPLLLPCKRAELPKATHVLVPNSIFGNQNRKEHSTPTGYNTEIKTPIKIQTS